MHCCANVGPRRRRGALLRSVRDRKTTLSADPDRRLIGDDEHGWSDNGVFNFEGGCYAKVIRLSQESEPEIYATTRSSAPCSKTSATIAITRRLDLDDDTPDREHPRRIPAEPYPERARREGWPAIRKNIIMLTADAFGVLPPIARLTPEQAMYHFLSGYTAKVAGTEAGVTEPSATFSACFGAPFMVLHRPTTPSCWREKIRAPRLRAAGW